MSRLDDLRAARAIVPAGSGKQAICLLTERKRPKDTKSYRKETTENAALHPHRCSWLRRGFIDKILKVQQHQEVYSPHPLRGSQIFDPSPVCTLALNTYLGYPASAHLSAERSSSRYTRTLAPSIGPPPRPVGGAVLRPGVTVLIAAQRHTRGPWLSAA